MNCSECGEHVEVDQLRCSHCGHDMLPEDIARQPLPEPTEAAVMMSDFQEGLLAARARLATSTPAVRPAQPARLTRQDVALLAVASEEMKRNRWKLLPILGASLLLAALAYWLNGH